MLYFSATEFWQDVYMVLSTTADMLCILQVWNPLGVVGIITHFSSPCADLGELYP